MNWSNLVAQMFNGLVLGALLALISSGLTIIYGTLGVLNLAHGAMFMIGGYAGYLAFEAAAPDDRLLAGLALAARRPSWRRLTCDALAKIGPRASATVAKVIPPEEAGEADAAFEVHHARWRAGLVDDVAFAKLLGPLLKSSYSAWPPYVALALGTPAWNDTIRAAIAEDERSGALEALARSPAVGARFLRELVAARREPCVLALWRDLPRETFWAGLSECP